jgi:hypothetical protein
MTNKTKRYAIPFGVAIFFGYRPGNFFRHYEGAPKSLELFYDLDITRAFKKSLEYIRAIKVCQGPFTITAF